MAAEVDSKIVKNSLELLSKVVKKPVVTEKLLKRPPFRFLHDLIISLVKNHGFLKDLYADIEMIADNVKEKEAKIVFLQKAIDATGFIIGDVINVKPSKIVAGLEVERTNEWLQTMAKAVIEKKSSADAVKRVLSGEKPSKRNSTSNSSTNNNKKKALNESTKTSNNRNVKTKREVNETKETKSEQKKQIIKESKQSKEVKEAKDSIEPKEDQQIQQNMQTSVVEENQRSRSPVVSANGANHLLSHSEPESSGIDSVLNGNASKPNSASHEDSPKIDKRYDDTNDQLGNKEREDRHNGSANNETVLQQRSESPKVNQTYTGRPKTGAKPTVPSDLTKNSANPVSRSVRPPTRHERPSARSARPSSSRPAPPRVVAKTNEDNKLVEAELEEKMRLINAKPVENLITENDDNEEDQDFVVTNVKTEDLEPNDRQLSSITNEQKGSLVKQLVDTKKELEGRQSTDVPNDDKKPIRQTNRDIEKLRQTIQSLSQTANPLGKVLDYLQEDIDFMVTELKSWHEEYKRNVQLLEKSRNVIQNELEPFRDELNVLDNDIRHQIETISATKANIIRNEERLQKMVKMVNRI